MSALLDARAIARTTCYSTDNDYGWRTAYSQTKHRVEIVSRFNLQPGSNVLEVGCGQGDFTVVLAAAVGKNGHVTAVDPASLDYGSPFTLGQAQSHISKGEFGSRITWVQNDPISFLESRAASEPAFDLIAFANSLWYFSSPSRIQSTLATAAKYAARVAIAEYTLHASPSLGPAAIPHVYAAFAQAALEMHKPTSVSNIRTVVDPKAITALATEANLKMVQEDSFIPAADVDDAHWETGIVRSAGFLEEVKTTLAENGRERALVLALREAMLASINDIPEGRKGIRMMDVWCAVFESAR